MRRALTSCGVWIVVCGMVILTAAVCVPLLLWILVMDGINFFLFSIFGERCGGRLVLHGDKFESHTLRLCRRVRKEPSHQG